MELEVLGDNGVELKILGDNDVELEVLENDDEWNQKWSGILVSNSTPLLKAKPMRPCT